MKKQLLNLLFAGSLLLVGCTVSSPGTVVERNTVIFFDNPKLTIQVSNEILFRHSARNKIQPSEGAGLSDPVMIEVESHIFNDQSTGRTVKISLEKLADPESNWEICLPDFSEFEDTIHTGSVTVDGILFSTGTFLFSSKNEWFLGRTYAKIFEPAKDTRLQIHYTEKITPPSQKPLPIEEFHNRADKSFTIQSFEEKKADKRHLLTTS